MWNSQSACERTGGRKIVKQEATRRQKLEKANCVHYWIIDKNNIGTCKKCGAVVDFGALQAKKCRIPPVFSKCNREW